MMLRSLLVLSALLLLLFLLTGETHAAAATTTSATASKKLQELTSERTDLARRIFEGVLQKTSNSKVQSSRPEQNYHRQEQQEEYLECAQFLVRFMPQRDLKLNVSIFIDTVVYAMRARREFPWGKQVPWPIFLNDVLPYSFLAEPRDLWRPLFFNYFRYNVTYLLGNASSSSIAIAEMIMNSRAWSIVDPPIKYVAAKSPVGLNAYSPFQVMARHNSSCTGLAIFLAAALRSIGVPARVTGTPHWNLGRRVCRHGDQSPDCGNHDWVEAWSNGSWAFIDQGDAGHKPMLNQSWFFPNFTQWQQAGTLNHSIFATSWAPSRCIAERYKGDDDPLARAVEYFPMVWDWHDEVSSAWDVTRRYLSMKKRSVHV